MHTFSILPRIRLLKGLIALILFVSSTSLLPAQTAILPTGTPLAAFNYRPLGAFWGYERGEMQYMSSELAAAGVPGSILITSVAFYCNSVNAPAPNTPVTIYLKEVGGAAGLTAQPFAAVIAPAQQCYTGNLLAASLVPGSWITFTLTTPFFFTGGGTHLEVIVETNFGGGGGEAFNGKVFARSTTSGTSTFQYWFADNTPPAGNGFLTATRPDVQIGYSLATPCATVPAGVATVSSPVSVCPNIPFTLSLSGLFPPYNSGYTYQWSSSTFGVAGPYTNIAGATNAIYANPGQLVQTWYRCQINCGASQQFSTPVQVNMNGFVSCYCGSSANSSVDTDIGQVVFASITNPAAPGPVTNNPAAIGTYSNFTATVTPPNLTQGLIYPITLSQITSGNFFFAAHFNVFIDYNHDGSFDPVVERVFTGGPTGPTSASPVTTSVSGNITIPFSSLLGLTRMRIVLREGGNSTSPPCGNYTWGETEDYLVNIVAGTPCNLTVAGTATTTQPNICPLQNFVLDVSGTVTLGSGMTWQWQSGPTSTGPWTNIAGANYIPFSTTQAVSTWYRCLINCGVSSFPTSSVQVIQNSPTQCYCVPLHIPNCNNMWTANVSIATTTLNNSTICSSNNGLAYNIYPASGTTTATLTQNQTYNLSVQTDGIVNAIISVWIDYNFNGVFEPTEWQQVAVSNPPGSTAVIPITIPGTSGTGLTGMRIRSRFSGNTNNASSACITFGSGETEDYYITINPFIPPACGGSPGPFVSQTNSATSCSGNTVILSLSPGAGTIFTGLNYQWYSGPTNTGPWTPIAGAIAKTHTFQPTATAWYQCIVECGNSGLTNTSSPVQITVQPATWLGFTSDWMDPTNWCGRVPTLTDDVQISLAASGRPAASYFSPLVAFGDSLRARNLTIAATDSLTILTDSLVRWDVSQSLTNNGRVAILSNKADSLTFNYSTSTTGLIQIFKGSIPDNIVQIIYTASELSAAGMQPNDLIDSIYFRFYNRNPLAPQSVVNSYSTAPYTNFSLSYMHLTPPTDQFVTIDPLLGTTLVYFNPSLLVTSPTNASYRQLTTTTAVLILPTNNFRWNGVDNLLLQICYDNVVAAGGNDLMYVTNTTPRKSTLWLGSTNGANSGCSLNSASSNLQSSFGQSPGTLRPNIGFRFRRAQTRGNGAIGTNLTNAAGSRFWCADAGFTVGGAWNNAGISQLDSTDIALSGSMLNTGTLDFSYTPFLVNRQSRLTLVGPTWQNDGAFTSGKSLVELVGGASQTIGGTAISYFNELSINKSAISALVTMNQTIGVNGVLRMLQGQLFMNKKEIGITNPLISAISRTSGMIISDDTLAKVNWLVNSVGGYRAIPFGSQQIAAPVYIPFAVNLKSGDLGTMSISTYNAPGNLPLPPPAFHLNSVAGPNNAANTVDRFWVLSKTGINPVADLTFSFTVAERPVAMNPFAAPGRAQPFRQYLSSGAWIRLLSPYTSVTYTQNYAQWAAGGIDTVRVQNYDWPVLPLSAGPTGNSNPWAIATSTSPLPVELLDFTARAVDHNALLEWTTLSESNNSHFTVERSRDNASFVAISTVPSQNPNSSVELSYSDWDYSPGKGAVYYRLRQTDFDGRFTLSEPRKVYFGEEGKLSLHYISTSASGGMNELHLFSPVEGLLRVEILDASGRLLWSKAPGRYPAGELMIPVEMKFSPGFYIVKVFSSEEAATLSFVR